MRALEEELTARQLLPASALHGDELREVGRRIAALAGYRDECFFQPLPTPGTVAMGFLALCPLREKSICDADMAGDTISGAFLAGYARAMGVPIVRANIAGHCWRCGENCVSPKGPTLAALVVVKRIFFLCLRRAGLRLCAVAVTSVTAVKSVGGSAQPNFTVYNNLDLQVQAFNAPHFKYCCATLQPWLYDSILLSIGGRASAGGVHCATLMMNGFAGCAAAVLGERDSGKRIYTTLIADRALRLKGVVGKAWERRLSDDVDPAAEAEAAHLKQLRMSKIGGCALSSF